MFVGQKLYKYVSSFRIYAACTINSKYAFFAVETSKNSVVVRFTCHTVVSTNSRVVCLLTGPRACR